MAEQSNGGQEVPSSIHEEALRVNLVGATECATRVAQSGLHDACFMSLVDTSGTITERLGGDCDPLNRALLERMYKLSHTDLQRVVVRELGTPEDALYQRQTYIPTTHGFAFLEDYASSRPPVAAESWERFMVRFGDLETMLP